MDAIKDYLKFWGAMPFAFVGVVIGFAYSAFVLGFEVGRETFE